MATCTFTGLTEKQAEILADWFEGQGEQDCCVWFDDRNTPSPSADVDREGGYMEIDEDGNVIAYCRS